MPRRALPRNLMRKAVHEKNIEDFIWACLELSCVELKKDGKSQTFNGRDIQSFLDHLVKIDKDKKDRGETTADDPNKVKEINDWLKQVK